MALEPEPLALQPNSLAGMFEADVKIRNRLRQTEQGKLTRWLKNENGQDMVGKCSMTTIAMNVRALTILARYWCPKCKSVKSRGIEVIRKEAGLMKKHVQSFKSIQMIWVVSSMKEILSF